MLVDDQEIDLRIAISPVTWGEQVVIRLLDKTGTAMEVEKMGMTGRALRDVLESQNAGVQRILDTMCQDKIDAKNEKIADLERQLTMANLAASQGMQTAAIIANNEAQTSALEQYLAPVPRPAYIVQNPNGCNCNTSCGCAF